VDITDKDRFLVIFNVLNLTFIMFKTLFFQKVNETAGLMSELIQGVVKNVIPFLLLFFLWVIFFSSISEILGSNHKAASGYQGINSVIG